MLTYLCVFKGLYKTSQIQSATVLLHRSVAAILVFLAKHLLLIHAWIMLSAFMQIYLFIYQQGPISDIP